MTSARSIIVSVIIPAFNESKNITRCLKSIAQQTYRNIEVILVDDFSSDNTVEIAKEEAKKIKLDLKIVRPNKHNERGIARNLGAKSAKGEYLLFIDADMELEGPIVSRCVSVSGSSHFKAVIIPEESIGEGFWAGCRTLEKKCYLGDDHIEAARFFEKNAFWEVGGWDPKMISGEDWDLTKRIRSKFKIGRVRSFIIHNEGHLSLRRALRKKFYYGSVSGIYLEKNPINLLNIIFFIFRPAYVRNWKLISKDPLHALGMFLLKGMEILAGGFGFIYSKIANPV